MAETTSVREGDLLAGKYRVDRVIGSGGMGVVVAARHLGLDTKVAIKMLRPEMLNQEEVVARFGREAKAAARITNEHVARVFDVGTLDNGTPYLVMEFLDGTDLHQWVHTHGPLPIPLGVDFVLQACEAIAEAHELGIVHRDLKPANLFCVRRADGSPFVKVLDFGISKLGTGPADSASQGAITRTAAAMGTPFYMSPEQMESAKEVDSRADLWALGVILYELLTGTVPFGGSLPEVCIKVATQPAPPIRRVRADVPGALEAVILKCMEKDRRKRFASVADLVRALAPFRAAAAGTRMRGVDGTAPTVAASFGSMGEWQTPNAESLSALGHTNAGFSARRKMRTIGLLTGALVVSGIATAILIGMHRNAPDALPASSDNRAAAEGASSPGRAVEVPAPPKVNREEPRTAPSAELEPLVDRPAAMPTDTPAPAPPKSRRGAPGQPGTQQGAPKGSPAGGRPPASQSPPASSGDPGAGSRAFDERL